MPAFRRYSRQWAEAKIAEIKQIAKVTGANTDREIGEQQELTEGLAFGKYPDDPSPVYSAEELEAAGQQTLDW